MESVSGRFVIVFNGEVYNFATLRVEVESSGVHYNYRGRSDTEVLLACIETWGLQAAAKRFIGMFAFALWDRVERQLHLVRDRMGVKPLYCGWSGGAFLFASELKALCAWRAFDGEIDRDAVAALMKWAYIPTPHSIYRSIRKIAPGTIVTVDPAEPGQVAEARYWSLDEVVRRGTADPLRLADADAVDALDDLLRDAVRLRMIADVPLGVFLSGGVDSSVVTALMQLQSAAPVKTFTVGFEDAAFNEAERARRIAAHLGTHHEEHYVSLVDALAVVPRLPRMFDEPMGDSSQIPTFLVSEMARRHVTVSLSGDGGDELFGGYDRYLWGDWVWQGIRRMPFPARAAVASVLRSVTPGRWNQLQAPGERLHKLARLLRCESPDHMYGLMASLSDEDLVTGALPPPLYLPEKVSHSTVAESMMHLDSMTYLADDILTKVDRASMAVGLEAREPLLDHRIVEFAWRLPLSQRIRGGGGKWLLRQVLYRYVPKELVAQPKMGFSIPLHDWLRGPLREWAEALLAEDRLRREGFLRASVVRKIWCDHLLGRRNAQHQLWTVLMFQAWLEERGNPRGS